jgi:tetratricopeptide (TPR) repeat protein
MGGSSTNDFEVRLANARYLEKTGGLDGAEQILVGLITSEAPEPLKATALFELGAVVGKKNDLPRAEMVNAQFVDRWPKDPRIPEVLLRQGRLYRQMGLNSLALTKFYSVMTAALSLKSDRPDYYPGLVLEAQVAIAETHYLMGRYNEAVDYYSRLLKLNNPALNRAQSQYCLIRSLVAIEHNEEAVAQARDFLAHSPDAPEQPEVRFYLAQTLKKLGQNTEALQQVLWLLREEKSKTKDQPELWAYWQQRAGNEVANQLYREGDYMRALDIYVNLAQLDPGPGWQLPVKYQIGLTYERLEQPQKAIEKYLEILKLETQMGTNATPGQKAVFDMARWRAGFLGWQRQAEATNLAVVDASTLTENNHTNLPAGGTTP